MENIKQTKLLEGISLTKISDERFNTNLISIGFVCPLSEKNASEIAILPHMLRRASRKYPDMISIENELASLYGARIEPFVRKKGETLSAGFICDIVDETLLGNENNLIKSFISMLCSLITEPLTENSAFIPELLESEKEKLCDRITSELNDKRVYSIKKMIENMCMGEAFATPAYGTIETVKSITPSGLYETYQKILSNSPIEIFCCGRLDEDKIISYFKEGLSKVERNNVLPMPSTNLHTLNSSTKFIKENMDVVQGKLTMGFNTGITANDSRYPALILANAIFGSGTTSKLFVNVREKMSLCYYASSSIDKHKGILIVSSGIKPSDFEATKNEILHQLSEVQNGNISDEELNNAKLTLISAYNSIQDSPSETEGFLFAQITAGCNYSITDLIEKISNTSKEEIVKVSSEIKLDTIYFLTGKEDSNE